MAILFRLFIGSFVSIIYMLIFALCKAAGKDRDL
ncbi:hypothetical protein CPAST_c06340 [Clostridium pasteurianum DSM 525 = ATCC 6013]|uniref:Uncharacterized protein n=1 Tax=Clostridium pasteurianum DSM 525 = ATCC 6013 TaxID=1262449 RepID=A0A0H3J082_CLOPA|nr:hypothetical protein CPAST_c06340 [Clostridium pasteurianum DSM 525 = ATCC 6013]AJA50722.1 hypothetical protein CLPA_c06340 [Clostridium pasteurianum DSM 525 = ATCC 6013]KRU13267.1 hypothetical protein CP6013_02515 [Clostridium pasteurianum DSM 525 = ATCC 6013]